MNSSQVRVDYPDQWLVVEALEARTEDSQRRLDRIAVLGSCTDGKTAFRKYQHFHEDYPFGEFYFVHTAREKLDIRERHLIGARGQQCWLPFPDPRKGGYLIAPFGPGVYQLRHISNRQLILFGRSKNVALRMTSLLPKPLGRGTRDNTAKQMYVLDYITDIEYRALACESEAETIEIEQRIKMEGAYLFPT